MIPELIDRHHQADARIQDDQLRFDKRRQLIAIMKPLRGRRALHRLGGR